MVKYIVIDRGDSFGYLYYRGTLLYESKARVEGGSEGGRGVRFIFGFGVDWIVSLVFYIVRFYWWYR